jgi:hypothetical protein
MNYTCVQAFQIQPVDPDRLSAQCDRIMEELVDLGVADPLISGDMATGDVEIFVMVEADSHRAAADKAMAGIRTAIHAAGGGTPDWPRLDETTLRATGTEVADADVPIGV